jgi:DMSO/TMAO reductase YedYZ molybdopterin-dependent catalytic subunit
MAEENIIRSPDMLRSDRVPPGQHLTTKWPVLHYGQAHVIDTAKWAFTITGLVEQQRRLTFAEFSALPLVKVASDIHCVTSWSRLDNLWEGVSASTVRNLVTLKPRAAFVIVHAAGGFTANLTLDDFLQPDVLFALMHDSKPITPEHGYPVRLVVPRLYFWKSAKWVTGIEFTAEDRPGFWESAGYHNHGDPWTEERYSSD